MKTKIWNVVFGSWTNINVVANNPKQAIDNAIKKRKNDERFDIYKNSLQYVTEVTLVVEES